VGRYSSDALLFLGEFLRRNTLPRRVPTELRAVIVAAEKIVNFTAL
jgi:hypothetical protein